MGTSKSNDGGILVNIASVAGIGKCNGGEEFAVYCATKCAVAGYSTSIKVRITLI